MGGRKLVGAEAARRFWKWWWRGRPVLMGEVGQGCGVQEQEWQLLWQKKEGGGVQPGVGSLGLGAQYRN
jgi:hypothetical protein